ncbi:hypothetical protein [Pantoea agglomerans]|uniref:hypothetical protein n=1 Tax=Enterobacter agglomerans TaxID=549 RepID=UPI0037C8BCB3
MNTQKVKTAATKTTETWAEGQNINGLDPALAQSLDYLRLLKSESMTEEERFELLTGTLMNMAEEVCKTVTDWSRPRPMIPLASFKAWIEAAHIAHGYPDGIGDAAWGYASSELALILKAGYAMHKADIA